MSKIDPQRVQELSKTLKKNVAILADFQLGELEGMASEFISYNASYCIDLHFDFSAAFLSCVVEKCEEFQVLRFFQFDAYMDDKDLFSLEKTCLITYSHGEYYGLGKKLGKFGYSVKKRNRKSR